MQSSGGFLIAVKNVEGDILSELVQNGKSYQGMMINESRGAKGEFFYETNHGTLSSQYHEMLNSEHECMSNPTATIYVWAQTLLRCADSEHNIKLKHFAQQLLESLHLAVERDGKITKDLASNRSLNIPMVP